MLYKPHLILKLTKFFIYHFRFQTALKLHCLDRKMIKKFKLQLLLAFILSSLGDWVESYA
jgi:hypothetical protein